MNQSTYTATGHGKSQCARILAALESNAGEWVPMPDLSVAGNPGGFCMVHSRIADLRKRGHDIAHRNEHRPGCVASFYRLTPTL